MAVQLEQDIMREIGLGQHYNYFNSSGSCEYIRKRAARELPDVLRRYRADGKEVAPPNDKLCSLLERVAGSEESRYTLTNTWCAASYVIQAHLYLYYAKSTKEKRKIIDNFSEEIIRSYLPKAKVEEWDMWTQEIPM